MNKTITVYELLGLVKDGKVPKHIKYKDYDLVWEESLCYYRTNRYGGWEMFYFNLSDLNDTIEIIEDNDKLEDNIINADEMKNIGKNLGLAYRKLFEGFKEGWESIEEKLDER